MRTDRLHWLDNLERKDENDCKNCVKYFEDKNANEWTKEDMGWISREGSESNGNDKQVAHNL